MRLTFLARVSLVLTGLLVSVIGWFLWAIEDEYGGNEAVDNYRFGYLVDGSVEVREIAWGFEAPSGDFEVEATTGDRFTVRLVDLPEGRPAERFTGSPEEVALWLDAQGPRHYLGEDYEDSYAWLEEQRDAGKSFVLPTIVIVAGGLVVLAGFVPRRSAPSHEATEPERPLVGAGR